MSASTAVSTRELPRRPRTPSEPLLLRILEFGGVTPILLFLGWAFSSSWADTRHLLPSVAGWLLVVAIADLKPIPIWGSVEIAISFPVLLAGAFVFPPHIACLLGFAGPLDLRELRREITLMRGLFNRANIAGSVLAASAVFHGLQGDLGDWPVVLAPAFAALFVDVALNGALVTTGTHLLTGVPLREVWRNISGGDQRTYFLLSYLAFGFLAILLAAVHQAAGSWSLIAFAVPLLLARQMFVHWKQLGEASEELLAKQRALLAVTERIADERRDERLAMAAGIHDEVLPPLYQVHLMGQVLRQDLASGHLLELEADVPDLLRATEVANDAIRALVRDMRTSPLGSRGVTQTLVMFVDSLRSLTEAAFEVDVEEVGGSALTQLLVYQIAREALSNAARHSAATHIRLFLGVREGSLRLVVQDDGRGFEVGGAGQVGHFGLQLMRERAEMAGGILFIESAPGIGATLVARIPIQFEHRFQS
ncbi:MAG: sensor histidine kinase [Solirubrobacterales bacterium]|jgi:signal transduction histidine kinase